MRRFQIVFLVGLAACCLAACAGNESNDPSGVYPQDPQKVFALTSASAQEVLFDENRQWQPCPAPAVDCFLEPTGHTLTYSHEHVIKVGRMGPWGPMDHNNPLILHRPDEMNESGEPTNADPNLVNDGDGWRYQTWPDLLFLRAEHIWNQAFEKYGSR